MRIENIHVSDFSRHILGTIISRITPMKIHDIYLHRRFSPNFRWLRHRYFDLGRTARQTEGQEKERGRADMENGQNRFISTTPLQLRPRAKPSVLYSQLSGFQRVIIARDQCCPTNPAPRSRSHRRGDEDPPLKGRRGIKRQQRTSIFRRSSANGEPINPSFCNVFRSQI